MINLRLLAGILLVSLSGAGVRAVGQEVYSIEEIFSVAETGSTQLRPYFSAVQEARKAVDEAKTNRLPDISARLSLSYIGDGFTTKRDFSDYQRAPIPHFGSGIAVTINQPVYAGGSITAGIEQARNYCELSRLAADHSRAGLRFRLAGLYLDLYKYHNLAGVIDSNLRQARMVLDRTRARHAEGTVIANDVTRYELLVANLELQLLKVNNLLDVFNADLVTLSGLPEGTIVLPDTTILSRVIPYHQEQQWREWAESNSPALNLARRQVEINLTGEKLTAAERLPKIGLQAGWNLDGPILVEVPPINRNLSYWFVGVGVSYNISSLYKADKSLSRSRIATTNARERLEATRQEIDLDLHNDYVKYMEAIEEHATQLKSVALARSNYDVVATRYEVDMALITDMLDAANSQLDAEQRLVNARIDIIFYYYKLLYTSGKI